MLLRQQRKGLEKFRVKVTDEKIRVLFEAMDLDGDGYIDFQEFLHFVVADEDSEMVIEETRAKLKSMVRHAARHAARPPPTATVVRLGLQSWYQLSCNRGGAGGCLCKAREF